MPQLSQLSDVLVSQLFWLAIGLGFIFFVIARGMVPKIQATVDAREAQIASDLAAADHARKDAEAKEQAWRDTMDSARADAHKVTQDAKDVSALDTEAKAKKSADRIARKVAAAQGKIRDALTAARAEIEAVAAEAAQDMVGRLTGVTVERKDAARAVKAELHG
ncbi:MAG: ATPase [Pseudomonadota bacterium]|nr:ATPase [Pseudomonadota bacterium]